MLDEQKREKIIVGSDSVENVDIYEWTPFHSVMSLMKDTLCETERSVKNFWRQHLTGISGN